MAKDDLNITVLDDSLHRDIQNSDFELVVDNDDSNAAMDDAKKIQTFSNKTSYITKNESLLYVEINSFPDSKAIKPMALGGKLIAIDLNKGLGAKK